MLDGLHVEVGEGGLEILGRLIEFHSKSKVSRIVE